jgi:Arc/MetJ-type ribon-helix-helix transcriptional regulator
MTPKKTFTFAIPDEMKKGLEAVRERDGISEAEQIRRGVQMWLESKGVKAKAASRRASTRRKA